MIALQSSLPMILNRTLDGVMPVYRELFAAYDLTEQQWRILRALWEVDAMRSADLAAATLLPKPSLVGILDRLEARGLVHRQRQKDDRRNVTVACTAEGRKLADTVLPQAEAINAQIEQLLSQTEWKDLNAMLRKVTDGMGNATMRGS